MADRAARILLVDDAPLMRALLREILEGEGYEVSAEAVNGEEAIERYREIRPQVVTMDILMPGLDGIASLRAIRSMDAAARVVMVSAVGQEGLITEAMAAGAAAYILKPFNQAQVVTTLKKVVGDISWT